MVSIKSFFLNLYKMVSNPKVFSYEIPDLQVDEIVNISCPLRGRYQETPSGIKRCLKLSMTDGVQRVFAMEYRPIQALEVFSPAGQKVFFLYSFCFCTCYLRIVFIPNFFVVHYLIFSYLSIEDFDFPTKIREKYLLYFSCPLRFNDDLERPLFLLVGYRL